MATLCMASGGVLPLARASTMGGFRGRSGGNDEAFVGCSLRPAFACIGQHGSQSGRAGARFASGFRCGYCFGGSGEVVGQSYTWWDERAGTYKSVWCDNMQGCTEFTTLVRGDSWTVELDGMAGSRNVHTTIRATMSPDHDCIHEEFANSYDGGPPTTETVSEYRRIIAGMSADKQPACRNGSGRSR